ncbi:histidine kinase [Bacteroides sp. GD17]|jgi:sensor histidine kinase YesM|uniref:sensor histidine kinase n=1 Tax=Bacteroides sp. GD17 TaxID=3139826 RepID=UPI0025D5568E|nr:histidine kinase [uncultured Bacteroides sp.]
MILRMIKTDKKYIQLTVLVSLVVGFLIHFPELVSLTDALEQQMLFPGMSPVDVLFEVGYTFLSLLILFIVNTLLFGFNNPAVRMSWWKVLLSFMLTWLLSRLLGELFVYLHRNFNIPAIDAMVHHYLHPIRDLIISLIVTGTCYISYLIRERQEVLLQNGKLHAENIQNQYQALKNQLNPHMLFNSLNTLQSLVRESPEKAQDYIRELSRVLRYTLQENDTHTVTLREEMDFVDAYIFLMKMRYEDNLHFEIKVDEHLMDYRLPPLSVQTLVENAIKHNEISNRNPLTIEIRTVAASGGEDTRLCIDNDLQLRRTVSSGTGIGLANLSKRYELLLGKEIQITEANGKFSVCVPLVKP